MKYKIKQIARWGAYYAAWVLEPRSMYSASRPNKATVLCDRSNATFFGYHDKTPFSKDGSKILAMSMVGDDTKPETEGIPMHIGFFKRGEDECFVSDFHKVGVTTTWCWQQGCMLQWHPTNADQIVYNKLIHGQYGSVVHDINREQILRTYPHPIYSLNPSGKNAVTLNFARLGRLRPGYGYVNVPDDFQTEPAPKADGLFMLDLDTEDKRLCISLQELAGSIGQCKRGQHYVNHAIFSSSGKFIAFFHLWADPCNASRRSMRMLIMDTDTYEYHVLEDERTVSHYCWQNDTSLLATTKDASGQMSYTLYDVGTRKKQDLTLPIHKDGHPMFHPNRHTLFVSDTYPDWGRRQHLFIADLEDMTINTVISLHSPIQYGSTTRCDLHPRWDRKGNWIAFDSTVKGRRALLLIPYSGIDLS